MRPSAILGIGTDLLDIRRIEKTLARFPQAFPARLLSQAEQTQLTSWTPNTLAKRFAAKEACAKACGTGIGAKLGFKDMTLTHCLGKPPQLALAMTAIQQIWPTLKKPQDLVVDLSLSDEYPYVQAFVLIRWSVA